MSRLNACLLAVWLLVTCAQCLASASAIKNFLQSKRSHQAVPEVPTGNEVQAEQGNEEPSSFAYTPEAFPPCVSVEYLTVLKDRFETQIDNNTDYIADFDEMKTYLRKYNPNIQDKAVAAFMKRRDMNGDGIIDFIPEYLTNVITPDFSIANAREWFMLDDTDGNGEVTKDELMTITRHIGTPQDQAEAHVSSYYLSNDKNGDGQLNWDEYKVIYGQ